MVVWVYSGGGDAEVRGFFPFLDKTFPGCRFERKTPVIRKPGPKANKAGSYGRTGQSLIEQIKQELPIALKAEPNKCDLILVFDDLDCRDSQEEKKKIEKILEDEISKIPECADIKKIVGFAAPEIEAWIIADWNNSIAKHSDFRGRHERMRWWLSTQKKVSFENPESFSEYDSQRDCCREKLSEALIDSSVQDEVDRDKARFSKGYHTPLLLMAIDPNEVQKKCPLFRELYNYFTNFCRSS
ncbi:DUF4276 family protein [Microcoleus sp. S13_C5]|uniref:DUF4276 family protein n=1 Tax=Microcoleus sp. S13_C5 TaxID=3055411 RepID=UPI002FCF9821